MVRFLSHQISLLVLCCVTLHLWWAAMLIVDAPSAIAATPMSELDHFFTSAPLLITMLLTASVSAFAAMLSSRWKFWLLIPQQILLMMSSSGALTAMWLSQYADGVLRPQVFVATDQGLMVILAAWHTVAILAHARRRKERSDG